MSPERDVRCSPRLWAALVVGALLGAGSSCGSAAADEPSAPSKPADAPRRVTLTAEPLADELKHLAEQAGIVVRVAPADIRDRIGVAVDATVTPADALRSVIGNAPLVVRTVQPGVFALDPVHTIGSTTTSTMPYTTTRSANTKYTQPLVDTPQTIVAVPEQVLKDQNVTTLHDALRNVSGISLAAGEGGSQGDSLTIRGFDAKDDFYLDGMRDFGNYYRDPFDLERVEVVMGPSSMLFGHGEGGGLVNQVSKTAGLHGLADASYTVGTDGMERLTLDDDRTLGATSAYRVVGMAEATRTADRDVTRGKRIGLAPSLAFGLGTKDRLTVRLFAQSDDAVPDYGIPYINDRPANVARSNFYGFANGDRLEDEIGIATIAYDHDVSDRTTLHAQLRAASYERSFGASNALTPSPQPIPGTPTALITVPRTQHSRNGNEAFLQEQTYLTSHVGTGVGSQTLLVGFEATRETSHETQNTVTGLSSTNLAIPNPAQPFTFTSIAAKTDAHVAADTLAFFGADSVELAHTLDFDAGMRFDTFAASNNDYVSKLTAVQVVRKLSPQAAFVYKPAPSGSIYLAYDTSFQPSADNLSLTTAQVVAPASNTTFELGTKWATAHGITVTAALFNSVMKNAHITEPDGTVLPVGTERSNGFQTQVQGELAPHWLVTAGYTLLQTKVLAYTLPTQPHVVGTRIPNAPTGSATLWTTYTFPRATIGFGASGLSQRQASIGVDTATGQPILVPGYVRFDGELKYRLAQHLAVQLNAANLLDKYYLDELHPDHVIPGAGRSFGVTFQLGTGR
jgi:catecholate siderophore receptor